MVEPFAIGMQAALRARIQPGDVAVVTGWSQNTVNVTSFFAIAAHDLKPVIRPVV